RPGHLAQAGDARRNLDTLHVPDDDVAELDQQLLGDAVLERDLSGIARDSERAVAEPLALDDRLAGRWFVAIGRAKLPAQRPPRSPRLAAWRRRRRGVHLSYRFSIDRRDSHRDDGR